jgi:hypothetical protein
MTSFEKCDGTCMNPTNRGRRFGNQFVRSAQCRLTLAIAAIFILAFVRVNAGQQSGSSFVIRNAQVFDGEKIIASASVVVRR